MSGDRLPTVLLYHRIEPVPSERTSLPPDTFRAHLDALRADGWQFVPIAELLPAVLKGGYGRTGLPWLAVTFDDGYADVLDVAPYLGSQRIPTTVFLLTDAVGGHNWWNPKAHAVARHLSRSEIDDLTAEGIDFQFHGTDHHRLTKFDPEQLDERFRQGCAWFEAELGRRPRVIAYPYGSFNAAVLASAARVFDYGLSVTQGSWGGEGGRHALNRLEIESWMSPEFLVRLLSTERRRRGRLLAEGRASAGR